MEWSLFFLAVVGSLMGLAAAAVVRRRLGARVSSSSFLDGDVRASTEAMRPGRPRHNDFDRGEAVTLLKPLHGDTGGLAANLASFLEQDYPATVRMLCGVAAADDPAARAVAGLADGRVELVVTGETGRANRKVGNLIGLAAHARHGMLVLSDADIRVPAGYLKAVVAALDKPGVGAVTCLYTGASGEAHGPGKLWRRLAAMDIDYRFLPNAVFGTAIGLATPCFGATIALRAETLAAIGGFEAFTDVLADDYEIGRTVRRLGLKIAIPPLTVVHRCGERTLGELAAHELRWSRTIRRIDPAGHAGSLVTYSLPLALIGGGLAALAGAGPLWVAGPPLAAWAARWIAKGMIDRTTGANAGPGWLIPARDVLSFAIFLASFAGDTVTWSGRRYRVRPGGVLSEL